MFLFNFKKKSINIQKILVQQPDIHIITTDKYQTILSKDRKKIQNIKKKIQTIVPRNPFNVLIDDSITIVPISMKILNNNFNIAYNYAYNQFQEELLVDLQTELIDLRDNNIITLPPNFTNPYKFNSKSMQNIPIYFRKDIFLKTYNFIEDLNNKIKPQKKKLVFDQLYKYTWKKIVISLD